MGKSYKNEGCSMKEQAVCEVACVDQTRVNRVQRQLEEGSIPEVSKSQRKKHDWRNYRLNWRN
jgi:hypothetical protein